jgi:hypothetical protein
MSQEEIQLLEEFIDEQQVRIKDGEALERLLRNRDFKRLIDNGLFSKEATRLVMLKADPDNQDEFRQAEILKGIDSIGYLRNHFKAIESLSGQAKLRTNESRQAIDEIRSEISQVDTDHGYTNE